MSLTGDYITKLRQIEEEEKLQKAIGLRDQVVSFKKLREDAIIPSYGSSHAAGLDLYYCGDYNLVLLEGEIKIVPCGVAVALPRGYHGQIWARSGNATRRSLTTEAGIIDEDYRGEVGAICANRSRHPLTIEVGERVAQMVIVPNFVPRSSIFLHVCGDEEDLVPCGTRGSSGFGSTGQ